MIRYIEKGDIFRIEGVRNYAHGCNCLAAYYEYDVALMNLLSLCGTPEQFANYQPKP